VGATEASLRSVNGIQPGILVRAGSTLIAPKGAHDAGDISADTADSAQLLLIPEGRRITVTVRKGDTLARVGKRYGVTPADIARWNKLVGARLKAGQQLALLVRAKVRTS